MVNCSPLAHRADFNAYAHKLLNVTGGDLYKVAECKIEVCGALWGSGNGDISGIGVSRISHLCLMVPSFSKSC